MTITINVRDADFCFKWLKDSTPLPGAEISIFESLLKPLINGFKQEMFSPAAPVKPPTDVNYVSIKIQIKKWYERSRKPKSKHPQNNGC